MNICDEILKFHKQCGITQNHKFDKIKLNIAKLNKCHCQKAKWWFTLETSFLHF